MKILTKIKNYFTHQRIQPTVVIIPKGTKKQIKEFKKRWKKEMKNEI